MIYVTQTQVNMKLGGVEFSNQVCDKLKNVHTFENLGQSDLVIFVYLGLVSMHICLGY